MLISLLLEPLLAALFKIQRIRDNARLQYAYAEWRTGTTLQIQRLAYENLGMGTWSKTEESIPVTERGETLGALDISDLKHARLVRPPIQLQKGSEDEWGSRKTTEIDFKA